MSSTMMDVSGAMAGTLPTVPLAGVDGELLPIADLLQLLEQNADAPADFSRALLTASAETAVIAGATVDTTAAVDAMDDEVATSLPGDIACDIATLLRLLESRPADPLPAQALVSAPVPSAAPTPSSMPPPAAPGLPPILTASGDGASDNDEDGDISSTAITVILPGFLPGVPAQDDAGDVPVDEALASSAQRPTAQPASNPPAAQQPLTAQSLPGDADVSAAAATEAAVRILSDMELPAHETPDPARPVDPARPGDAPQSLHGLLQGLKPAVQFMGGAGVMPERLVQVPMHDPGWPQAVAAEIRFLADHRIDVATLRLNPAHLGPVEVRIDMRDEQVSVSFGVHHGDTQAALEQSLPRLREMFAAAGLHLGEASVQQEARRDSQDGAATLVGQHTVPEREGEGVPGTPRSLGLVDEYA